MPCVLKKPKTLLTLFATIAATLALIFLSFYEKSQIPSFQEFDKQLFSNELKEDGLSAHFLIKHQDSLFFSVSQALPLYHGVTDKSTYEKLKKDLNTLDQIKLSQSTSQKTDYLVIHDYLSQMLRLAAYPYLGEPLSPNGGLHTEVLLLLSAYPFYELEDVENYLSILKSFDAFTNSILQYEQEKKDNGLFMSYTACKKVMDQCMDYAKSMTLLSLNSMDEVYSILDDPERSISFLSESFLQNLLCLYEKNEITEADFLSLFQEQQTLLQNTVSPCYERLADGLWLLSDPSIQTKGLCNMPDGKKYYEALLSFETGSDKSVQEMKELLEKTLSTDYKLLCEKAEQYLSHYDSTLPVPSLSASNTPQQLSLLNQMISQDFPLLSQYYEEEINCNVVFVPKSLAEYTAPAYYIQTPVDYSTLQSIYINPYDTSDALTQFTTLAHEGYPGHLYQHVISSATLNRDQHALCRFLFQYPGFQEGWAVYSEFYAYAYIAGTCNPEDKDYYEMLSLDKKTTLCLYALIDIMIHENGCDYGTIHQFLSQYGITSPFTTQKIFEYIAESPCNYMKYFMGYLEVLECKELAKEYWKDTYTDQRFHTKMLEFGSAPFSIIKEEIKASSY